MTRTEQTPQRVMAEAANAVETFTRITFDESPDWKTPPHTYNAIGPMARLARDLVQGIDQLGYPIARTQAEGRLALDDDSGPVGRVARFKAAQDRAQRAAHAMAQALGEMHAAASAMGYDTRGLPEYEDDAAHALEG
jgi:hypothetical protein